MVEEPLRHLGALCVSKQGCPPLAIQGPIQGGTVTVDGSQSSQFVSGLLMALPLCQADSTVCVHNLKSAPYVRMTISLLKHFGIHIKPRVSSFEIPGQQKYSPTHYSVEGDWSGAAFFLVAGAIAGRVTATPLTCSGLQADQAILSALRMAGAAVTCSNRSVTVRKAVLRPIQFDASDCPDLFPPLVVLAMNCAGSSSIKGVGRLLTKESNRALVLAQEFNALGAAISIVDDTMHIQGKTTLRSGTMDPHGDHRIAMAAAIAARTASSEIHISDAECVEKSLPDFFRLLQGLQAPNCP